MERTAGVVRQAANGQWQLASSVIVAVRTRTECGEHIVCHTALGSVTIQYTTLCSAVRTPFSAKLCKKKTNYYSNNKEK